MSHLAFSDGVRNAYLWFGKPRVQITRAHLPKDARSFLTFGAYDYDIDFDGITPLSPIAKGDVIVLTFNDNNRWTYLEGQWRYNHWWSGK